MKTTASSIEILESRIAPASAFVTYTDIDGDSVKITATNAGAVAPPLTAANLTFVGGGAGGQLAKLDLSAGGFDHASIVVAVKKSAAGDGLANVGYINATNVDLGSVTVNGDLGAIDAGHATLLDTTGLQALSVRSLGRFGLATGAPDLESDIVGPLGAVKIAGDMKDAFLSVSGGQVRGNGTITSVTIGGALLGGAVDFSGAIRATGHLGAVSIGQGVQGGAGQHSGSIEGASLAAVTIGGSLLGGSGDSSGGLLSDTGDIGAVKITGDLAGSAGPQSGKINSAGKLTSLAIGGSLTGGSGTEYVSNQRGQVSAQGDIGPVTIGGSVLGGDGDDSASLESRAKLTSIHIGGSIVGGAGGDSAWIFSEDEMGTVKVGRDLIGGTGSSGAIVSNEKMTTVTIGGSAVGGSSYLAGSINSAGNIDAVTIRGSLTGGTGDESGHIVGGDVGPVRIGGDMLGGAGGDAGKINTNTLASLTIGGSLIGGTGSQHTAPGPDGVYDGLVFARLGSIGPVKIGRDFVGGTGASADRIVAHGDIASLSVGGSMINAALDGTADLGPVNIAHDLRGGFISGGGKLTSLTIGGSLIGGPTDSTGSVVVPGDIGAVRIGGDLRGSSISGGDATLSSTGYILGGRIASVFVGGSIIAGTDDSNEGGLTHNGSIQAHNDIGAITVKGSLIGSSTPNGTTPVVISARGQANLPQGATSDLAIKSLTVGGRVERAKILGGFDSDDSTANGSNGDASIGAVKVGGDWIASSLSAGVQTGTDSSGFGTTDDTVIDNHTPDLIARIASISIGGIVIGSAAAGDHFGFVAQEIGSFKSLGFIAPLTANSDAPIELSPITADVTIREV